MSLRFATVEKLIFPASVYRQLPSLNGALRGGPDKPGKRLSFQIVIATARNLPSKSDDIGQFYMR